MMYHVFDRICLMFSSASRDAKKDSEFLGRLSASQQAKLGKLGRRSGPALDSGLRFATNVDSQSIESLKKKEICARNLSIQSKAFWKLQEMRKAEIESRIADNRKRNMAPEHTKALSEERDLIAQQETILKHLAFDVERIEGLLKVRRKNDIGPLVAKANHLAMMINIEERFHAVNPMVLREFGTYEKSLQRKLEQANAGAKTVERDEYKTISELLASLKKETSIIRKEAGDAGKKEKRALDQRMKETVAHILMLENVLELAAVHEVARMRLRQRCMRLYEILEWVDSVEAEGIDIMSHD
jgi:hypothetical protein